MPINPLIAIPSPRDLEEFDKSVNTIRSIDKYWIKYYPELHAYQQMQRYFLANKQYDYLCILPDDCLANIGHVSRLISDIIKLDSPPVICGVANLDNSDIHKGLLSVCPEEVPNPWWGTRLYKWLREDDDRIGQIIPVRFAGFPLMFIRRDIVEKYTFKNDGACCIDLVFCWELYCDDYPILCDTNVRMHHLKIRDGSYQNMYVGVKQPYTKLERSS